MGMIDDCLAQATPYLAAYADTLAEKTVVPAAAATVATGKTIFDWIKTRLTDTVVQSATQQVEAAASDKSLRQLLAQVRLELEEQPKLLEELAALLKQETGQTVITTQTATHSGTGNINQISGNNNTIG